MFDNLTEEEIACVKKFIDAMKNKTIQSWKLDDDGKYNQILCREYEDIIGHRSFDDVFNTVFNIMNVNDTFKMCKALISMQFNCTDRESQVILNTLGFRLKKPFHSLKEWKKSPSWNYDELKNNVLLPDEMNVGSGDLRDYPDLVKTEAKFIFSDALNISTIEITNKMSFGKPVMK